jgi:hypothetical protein
VTFTSKALNLGPSTSQLDATISQSKGLSVTSQSCQIVSPDTPSCEWANVAPYQTRRMAVQAQITGAVGTYAVMTVCTGNEGLTSDPNSLNNCSTAFVKIISS